MPQFIHAVFENGVFRPTQPVDLPDHAEVELELRPIEPPVEEPNWDELYSILGRRVATGISDLAARHDEHQP